MKDLIEKDTTDSGDNIRDVIKLLKQNEISLIPINLPKDYPFEVFDIILRSESGAYFDELVRSGKVDNMVQQNQNLELIALDNRASFQLLNIYKQIDLDLN